VPLVWMFVLRAVGSSSPERRRRRYPLCAAARRRRRHRMFRLSSHARARRFGEGPAASGAPQRRVAFAPPLAGATPPLAGAAPPPCPAAGRTSPLQPLARERDRRFPHPAAQIAPRLWSDQLIPVNPNAPTRIRS
jgi:hypothetical protein